MQMGSGPGWLKSVVWDYFTNKDMLLIAFKGILELDFVTVNYWFFKRGPGTLMGV